MITIKTDGLLDPLNVIWTNQSHFELMPSTRDMAEQIDGADGELDFGTELNPGEYQLHCVSREGLSKEEKALQKAILAGRLNSWRKETLLVWESDPDKGIYTRLYGQVEFVEHPTWFEVTIPIKYQPLWVSLDEYVHKGSGVLINEGTFEAPFIVEISGPLVNPAVTINGETMEYEGSLASSDVLIIDTGKQTAKFNGMNAMAKYNKAFPKLQAGGNTALTGWIIPQTQAVEIGAVYDPGDQNAVLRWRHCWV